MRLGVLLPALVIAPAGVILYGLTAQHRLHWVGYFFAVAMTNWGTYFYFTTTMSYAVDAYPGSISEMLIATNLGRQAIAFGMASFLLDWVLRDGYAVVFSGIFTGVLLANNLAVLVFMVWGKRIRIFMSKTWIAQMHRRTATVHAQM